MIQDNEIIHQVLTGDVESFRFLVERYEKSVFRMIKNICGNKESCEDIAQDTFFSAYKKLSFFDPSLSSFSTWLFTIARNNAINALKKKSPVFVSEIPVRTDSSNPGDFLEKKDFFNLLDRALKKLPAKQKRAFVLVEFENQSYVEAAAIEKVRVGTVKSRVNRAKEKLRSILKGLDGDVL